jgi:alpha-beta hydrolase superfamily lysophospholipase
MSISKAKNWDIGTGVAGFLWDAENPRGNILLQHGLGEYAERYVWQYNQLIPKLVAKGFNVYAIDLPGHGDSEGLRGQVDLNEALMHHLAARTAIDSTLPLILFGHSLGGLVTAASVMANLELLKLVAADERMFHGKARNLVAKTVLELSDFVWSKVSSWQVPTLLIHGDQDLSTDHKQSIALAAAIPAKDKTLRIYQGGFHELLNDLEKDKVERELFDWILAKA